jgi:hypothetical protein
MKQRLLLVASFLAFSFTACGTTTTKVTCDATCSSDSDCSGTEKCLGTSSVNRCLPPGCSTCPVGKCGFNADTCGSQVCDP